jgi:hypothetical protein
VALITILHTFGKDLKFHPHLHTIAANGFFSNKFNSFDVSFKSKFNRLWRSEVLKNLHVSLDKYRYGFYVWSDEEHLNKDKQLIKYIGRYVRHPAIANGRIIDYTKKGITFYYRDNQDNDIFITKKITSFITSLIQHIPPKQFKLIRYYGAYSRKNRIND